MQGKHKEVGNMPYNTCRVKKRAFLVLHIVPSVDFAATSAKAILGVPDLPDEDANQAESQQ